MAATSDPGVSLPCYRPAPDTISWPILERCLMRNLIARPSSLFAALALVLLSACGVQDQDQADPSALVQPAVITTAPGDQIDDQKSIDTEDQNSGSEANKSCRCYTTCSSNGSGWTRSYYVGAKGSVAACSSAAAAFCRGKSPTYRYHNSACT